MRLSFACWSVVFGPGLCNKVGHVLAAFGAEGSQRSQVWLDEFAGFVSSVVASYFAVRTS